MVMLENMEIESSITPLLFHHMSELDEEDKELGELFERFSGPNEVFPYVNSLKEEGNKLFRLNDFNGASVKYCKAINSSCVAMSAICDDISDCDNNPWFRDLIISLTLNLAACGLKSKNFNKVVVFCSLILEADSKNVKALFRRGLAYVNLGIYVKAYDDLKRAKNLEPKNKDIVREISSLEKVILEGHVNKEEKKQMDMDAFGQEEVDIPKSMKEQVLSSSPGETKDNGEIDSENVEDVKPVTAERDQRKKQVSDSKDEDMNVHEVGSVEEITSPGQSSPSCLSEEYNMYDKNESLNLAESKYRFHNRKRQGSCLAVSKNDYNVLVQGKTIKCYNSKQGSFMEIRIQKRHDEISSTKSNNHNQEKTCSEVSNNQLSHEEEVHDNSDNKESMEVFTEVTSCMFYEENQAICVEGSYSSHNSMIPQFYFSASPKPKSRTRRFDAAKHRSSQHSSSQHQLKSNKRRKMPTTKNILSPPNIDCVCRFVYSRKRKCTHPPLGFHHHPRKKLATHASSCSYSIECPCHCNNVGLVSYACTRVYVYETHETASSQSNG